MSNRHKQPLLSIMIAVVALIALSAGVIRSAVAQEGTPGAGEKVTKVAVITPASRTNLGWDQQAVDSMEAVGKKLGIEVLIAENAGYGDITPALKDLKDEGAQLIICHASGYQTVCPTFAQQEGVKVGVIENKDAVTPNLISDIETQAQEVAYLAGVAAGKLTKTGTVAVVVSAEPPTWNYMTVGFAEGLKESNPNAKLLYFVIGEAAYDDAAGAKRVTEQALANGADIVFGMGDGASFGMIEAIREHNEANPDNKAWFIDVIGDKSKDYSDVLLTSVLFDYTGIYEQMIKDIEAGTFGKVYTMDVKNGGVRLLDLPDWVPQEVKDAVAAAQKDIVDGKITVSAIGDAEGMKAKLKELGYQ
ncbi:MAG: BMP family ABC transporter substrate-binding protein [Thermomicrobiales bacterium]|nr:MAG: BMP family ABC transporter substrate-binding protein [Thermomicrobiales bacterium]